MSKVFCIGMFKTGTTSIGKAFEILGYKTHHGPWFSDEIIRDEWFAKKDRWPEYYLKIKKRLTVLRLLKIIHGCFFIKKLINGVRMLNLF